MIQRILIANRGEIACRVMRTCREMGISTVAVFSEADRQAPFVREADEAVALGGLTPTESYLRIEAILAAAQKTSADAIHPGYGFLSENAEFVRQCEAAGLVFIGPSADCVAAMGSKIEAKRRMQEADVPVLPSVEAAGLSTDEVVERTRSLDWPVMVKASAGGGGRGMRIVHREEDLPEQLSLAQQESESAFGDGSVFVEPYVESPRHIEIQIFGDTHGNVIHLFERECSIQRRHQKILEESPSVVVDDALRQAMGEAAVRAGSAIGYVGAGTVEFLLRPDGQFYFLEVNTRLQVEHPVTELITGLDLVRLQIQVAAGEPLPAEATSATISGHAIEVRLYAEDPAQGFLPSTGRLERFELPTEIGVRVDSGVCDRLEVSPFYDSMLAKVIAHAPTRQEAAARLAQTLSRAQLHGPPTNRELLVRILGSEEFLTGKTDTHFLERHPVAEMAASLGGSEVEKLHAAAAALALQAERREAAAVQRTIPSGWRNNPSEPQQSRFTGITGELTVTYRFARNQVWLQVNEVEIPDVRVGGCSASEVELETEGLLRTYLVHRVGEVFYVDSAAGATRLELLDLFPTADEDVQKGSLIASLPGVVVEVKVQPGEEVAEGDVLVVIESMKMLHPVHAPSAGQVVQLSVAAGEHVEAGTVLAVIDDQATSQGN